MLVFLPFKKIVPLMGKVQKIQTDNLDGNLPLNDNAVLKKINISILRGAHYSPWRAKCFEQALAAKMMLKRRGFKSIIYFGVYKNTDTNKLLAHAWLKSNSLVITGDGKLDNYTIVSSFES
jgi:hypothetical protein